jgi:putative ABC transport system permease protein
MSATLNLATKQIRRGPRRVAAIVMAALLSAMALMATGTFITTMQASLNLAVAAPYSSSDIVVQTADPQATLDAAAQVPGVETIEPSYVAYAQSIVEGARSDVNVYGVADEPSLRWMDLAEGEWPSGDNEIVATQSTLDRLHLELGDEFELASYGEAGSAVTVVGVVTVPANASAGITQRFAGSGMFSMDDAQVESLIIQATPGSDIAATIDSLNAVFAEQFGTGDDAPEAVTVDAYTQQLIDGLTGGTDALATMFLIFVLIALLAAAMVIRNTFEVLLAQRLRENGLLRLVGATGAQVQRTVLAEALLIGVAGAVVGIAIGFGLGWMLAVVADLAGGGPSFAVGWAIAALVVTVAVTLFAAWAPAARLRGLSPIAALSEANATGADQRRRSVFAWVFGGLVTALGIAGLVGAVALRNPLVLIGAGVVLAIGLIVLVPLLVRVLMPVIGRLLGAFGPIAKLAGENLVRTSRRSGTVVLAISLGGSLILAMLTGVQSVNATLGERLDAKFSYDAVITSQSGESLDSSALAPVLDSRGLEASEATSRVELESSADSPSSLTTLTTLPEPTAADLKSPIEDGEVVLSETNAAMLEVDDGATATFTDTDGTSIELTVVVDDLVDGLTNLMAGTSVGAVSSSTLDEFSAVQPDAMLWLYAADGQIGTLADAITQVQNDNPELQVLGPIAEQQVYEQIVNLVVAFVLAMLGLTVVISVIGLASVVALAVAERRRELALLRALGVTRGRVRLMVLLEAVALALVGALFSIVIGIPLGVSAVPTMIADGGPIAISVPWLGIGVVIAAAVALGVIAGARPSWLASRIPPAQALARA